jgi:hypothetical protein
MRLAKAVVLAMRWAIVVDMERATEESAVVDAVLRERIRM